MNKWRPYTPDEALAELEAREIIDPCGIGLIRSVGKNGVWVSGEFYTYQEFLDKCRWRDNDQPCGVFEQMSNEIYDIAILIGNSDDKLTQREWRDFVTEIKYIVDALSVRVHFFGGPENYAPWQNVCAVFEIYTRHLPILEEKLSKIRTEFKQESLAILVGTTRLI